MNTISYALFFFMSFLWLSAHSADFTLEHLISTKKITDTPAYADPLLIKKMDDVFAYLKGSWCSQEKAKLIMEIIITQQLDTCVDVGTSIGSSALPMLVALQYRNKGHAYLIDAWSNQEAMKGLAIDDPNALWWSTLDMNAVKSHLLHTLGHWQVDAYATVMHETSESAVTKLDAIDFLHLDGNFSEAGALLDAQLYLSKVKPGGYILLSNVLVTENKKATKMKSLSPLFDACDIVGELERGNVLLFRKK